MMSQLTLYGEEIETYSNSNANKIGDNDKAFHNWYRFVLSFPPHLVRKYIKQFSLDKECTVLDPFCGTGTTIIEAKLNGIRGIGIESNPMSYFASKVKTDWDIDWKELQEKSFEIADNAKDRIKEKGSRELLSLPEEQQRLLITNSISPLPLHKSLILLSEIRKDTDCYVNHQLLAFASATVKYASNLRFGPEVGVSKKKKVDVDIVTSWLKEIKVMINDLKNGDKYKLPKSRIIHADSRDIKNHLSKESVDAVFTSPPYPNEKDYTRTTRLESVLLGFIKNKDELRNLKRGLLRSNTRNVYKDDRDDEFIAIAWFSLGELEQKNESYENAINNYQQCLNYTGDEILTARALFIIGEILFESKEFDPAIDYYEDVLGYDISDDLLGIWNLFIQSDQRVDSFLGG